MADERPITGTGSAAFRSDERPITGTGAAKFSRDERPIGGKRVKKRGEVDDWGSVDSAQSKALQERARQVVVKLEPEMFEWAKVGFARES